MKLSALPLLALITFVLAFSVGMASLLNYFKFESTVKKLQRSRIELVATEIRNTLEKRLALGADFTQSNELDELIERQRRADPLIIAIHVFDDAGHVIFSSQGDRAGTGEPQSWTAAARQLGAREWFVAEPDAFITGVNLYNSFGIFAGGVAVRYERAGFDRQVGAMGVYLGKVGLAIATILSSLVALVLFGLLALVRREFAAAELAMTDEKPGAGPLALEMVAFKCRVAVAEEAMADVHIALDRLGKSGR